MLNNSINSALVQAGSFLYNPKYISAVLSNIGAGDVDLYTVPAGRAAVFAPGKLFNSAGTSTTQFAQIKVSGTYYRIITSSVIANGAAGTLSAHASVLNAGESLAINTTQAGLNFLGRIIEFDPLSPLKTYRILSLANGDNTIMTVPSGKRSIVTSPDTFIPTSAQLTIHNYSGGSRDYIVYAGPNGSSIGTGTQIAALFSQSDNTSGILSLQGGTMAAGDFIAINTNSGTATQSAFINVIELPA